MPFKHKLASRLALMRDIALIASIGAILSCQLPIADPSTVTSRVVQLFVSPESLSLDPQQQRQFAAYGRTAGGDSAIVPVTWSATGGTITSSGMFAAGATPGDYAVRGTNTVYGLTASSRVHVNGSMPVASVSVTPGSASLTAGQTLQLTATPRDAGNNALTGRVVTWTSGNPAAASVNATGLVTAVATGPATITATSEGKSGSAGVAVTATVVPVATVSVTPASPSVATGQTVQLTATPRDAGGSVLAGRVVTWTSSNTAAATVSGSGLVTGVATGSATITATSEGKSGTAMVTVTQPPAPVASVSVTPAAPSVIAGQAVQLTATPRDAGGNALAGRVVTWGSANTAAATVNGSGMVSGVAAGSATITATSEGKSGTAAVTVTVVPVASVSVSPASANLITGQTVQLAATPRDAGGNALTGRVVTWATSNAAVATVNSTGRVTAVAAGSATITATSEGQNGTATVMVTVVPVASVSVSPASANLTTGQTVQLLATPRDASGNALTGRVVTWASSNTAIATVSGSGLVTGVAAGSATITATSEGKSATAAITVTTSSGGGTVLFQENFEDTGFGSRGWYDNTSMTITDTVHITGSTHALEAHFRAGATSPTYGLAARHLFTATPTLYISYWVKYSNNWVGSGKAYHPHEFNILSDMDGDWDGPSDSWLNLYVEQNYQNGGIPRLAVQDNKNINTSASVFRTGGATVSGTDPVANTEQRSVGGCNGGVPRSAFWECFSFSTTSGYYNDWQLAASTVAFQPNPGPGYKGNWNHVEVYFALNSIVGGIGQADGVAQYWFNGTLMIDRHDMVFRTGAHPSIKLHQLLFSPYIGDGSPVDQTMWLDDLVVATAKP